MTSSNIYNSIATRTGGDIYIGVVGPVRTGKSTFIRMLLGEVAPDSGTIDAPIARKPLPSLLREISPQGKPSVTEYKILEQRGELCKLKLTPVTGRTHQLRVHCAYMGFPILGDPQYGSEASAAFSGTVGQQTQLLCAKKLKFIHPLTGEMLCLCSRMDVTNE